MADGLSLSQFAYIYIAFTLIHSLLSLSLSLLLKGVTSKFCMRVFSYTGRIKGDMFRASYRLHQSGLSISHKDKDISIQTKLVNPAVNVRWYVNAWAGHTYRCCVQFTSHSKQTATTSYHQSQCLHIKHALECLSSYHNNTSFHSLFVQHERAFNLSHIRAKFFSGRLQLNNNSRLRLVKWKISLPITIQCGPITTSFFHSGGKCCRLHWGLQQTQYATPHP